MLGHSDSLSRCSNAACDRMVTHKSKFLFGCESCKNVTRLLSVTVWWVVILVNEVTNLLRFKTTSLDGWFPTFQRIIMVSASE